MSEPLTAALAEAASRFVGASKIGPRKGSVAAVARAMTEHGVEISNNTLSRKLAGDYPLNTDEIGALAAVLGVNPDAIWADALRIMREAREHSSAAGVVERAISQTSPEAQDALRKIRADMGHGDGDAALGEAANH